MTMLIKSNYATWIISGFSLILSGVFKIQRVAILDGFVKCE